MKTLLLYSGLAGELRRLHSGEMVVCVNYPTFYNLPLYPHDTILELTTSLEPFLNCLHAQIEKRRLFDDIVLFFNGMARHLYLPLREHLQQHNLHIGRQTIYFSLLPCKPSSQQ